jgi:hypothetical protein
MAYKDDEFAPSGKKIDWIAPNGQINYVKGVGVDVPMPDMNDVMCELQLSALGDFVPLCHLINTTDFKREIKAWDDKWVPYLRTTGVTNDREGMMLVGMEGDTVGDSLSMPEIRKRVGRKLLESEINVPTELYHAMPSLHPLLNAFDTLGRTMIVKLNKGGWFPPHRDHPVLSRDCFRIVAFCSENTDHSTFEWEHDYRRRDIQPGRSYYVDTRKVHRTACWGNDSIHLVMNIPKTWENVLKVMSMTQHY